MSDRTDGAGDEEFETVLFGELEHVVEAVYVDAQCERNVRLADDAQQRAEVHDPVDALVHGQLLQFLQVEDVRVHVRTYTCIPPRPSRLFLARLLQRLHGLKIRGQGSCNFSTEEIYAYGC